MDISDPIHVSVQLECNVIYPIDHQPLLLVEITQKSKEIHRA